MSDFPHVNAAFINAIAEEGTKADAVQFLQKQWNETCALRERLEQAERERDNYNAMYEQALITATQLRKYGFRAGIEAGRQAYDKIAQVYYGRTVRDMQGHFERAIRALSPTDKTPSVVEAAKVICDAWDADTLPVNDPDPMLPSFIAALRALAAQKGE